MAFSKGDRLREFFRRLAATEPAESERHAMELIAVILNAVEDEMTDVPADPTKWMTDGRMYPPQPDSRRDVPQFPWVTRYRSRGHNTFIAQNGAIEIRDLDGSVLFRKAGRDGRNVWEH